MKSFITKSTGILVMIAGSAFAGTGAGVNDNGWLWMLFLGFGALIVVFQLVPSVILLGAMLKGLFGSSIEKSPTTSEPTGTRNS